MSRSRSLRMTPLDLVDMRRRGRRVSAIDAESDRLRESVQRLATDDDVFAELLADLLRAAT